jgi:14-3-3 protein epsilon
MKAPTLVWEFFIFVSLCRACQVAKQAFDEATNEINSAGVEGYNDSILMMELLKDNLELWTSEPNEGKAIIFFLRGIY